MQKQANDSKTVNQTAKKVCQMENELSRAKQAWLGQPENVRMQLVVAVVAAAVVAAVAAAAAKRFAPDTSSSWLQVELHES